MVRELPTTVPTNKKTKDSTLHEMYYPLIFIKSKNGPPPYSAKLNRDEKAVALL